MRSLPQRIVGFAQRESDVSSRPNTITLRGHVNRSHLKENKRIPGSDGVLNKAQAMIQAQTTS